MPIDSPRLITIGCNHHHTPLAIRERMALSHAGKRRLQEDLRQHPDIREAAVLSTCNRLEVYAVVHNRLQGQHLARLLEGVEGFPVETFLEHAYILENASAVSHGFKVASGLDSQLVGETQILGQMKNAYAEAIEDNSVGPVLHRLFQKAFQAAKWARSETKIGTGQVSLGNVAVELATRIFGRLTVSRTLVIGSGEIGREVAKAFRSRGVACMSIASRTHQRAESLAREVDGLLIPFSTWKDTLPYVDIGIFATSAPGCILGASDLSAVLSRRSGKPIFLIDLAMPRDIETEIAEMPNVYLYNLDDLASIANENMASRQREVDNCMEELERRSAYTWKSLGLEPR